MRPYEIHLTVEPRGMSGEEFKALCGTLGMKGIVIDLDRDWKPIQTDFMTSQRIMGGLIDAHVAAVRGVELLRLAGLTVIREKVETAAWVGERSHAEGRYFESHIQIQTTPGEIDEFRRAHNNPEVHFSRNPFKALDGGEMIQMATLRGSPRLPEEFHQRVDEFSKTLVDAGLKVTKVERELVLWDSNESHDSAWVN